MKGFIGGALSAIIMLLGGWLIWQGHSQGVADKNATENLMGTAAPEPLSLPEGSSGLRGKAPPGLPALPQAAPKSREQKRFNRYDKDQDEAISRIELMASRSKDFKKLDKDSNNLLSFEEWAVKTADKFVGADADKNGKLTREEFATTAPKRRPKPECSC